MNQEWLQAGPLVVVIDQVHELLAKPKVFSTGSRGWYVSGKIQVGDERVQVSLCLTVVGSKADQGKTEKPARKDTTRQKRVRIASEPISVPNEPDGLWDGTGPLPALPEPKKGQG